MFCLQTFDVEFLSKFSCIISCCNHAYELPYHFLFWFAPCHNVLMGKVSMGFLYFVYSCRSNSMLLYTAHNITDYLQYNSAEEKKSIYFESSIRFKNINIAQTGTISDIININLYSFRMSDTTYTVSG